MEYVLLIGIVVTIVLQIIVLIKPDRGLGNEQAIVNQLRAEMKLSVSDSLDNYANIMSRSQKDAFDQLNGSMAAVEKRLHNSSLESEQKLEYIRKTMEEGLKGIQESNDKKLEEMRVTVDEKLQKTLEERIGKSFNLVSERLEQVHKGLGEMQSLATGVGDLKKILSNVKTRGMLGELQLGAILEQIMSKEQYEENVSVSGGRERVEYAVKLPGDDRGFVYLPIDAKYPGDVYARLVEAYEGGEAEAIASARSQLKQSVTSSAKDIHDKYIDPPNTTDFAIMFLPVEGLYAEVVQSGLVEELMKKYRINIAGPTTMAALLNSLQMGFRTLAIQKRSGEVWKVLGAVKTEFDKFGGMLEGVQKKLTQANTDLDKLVGVRTRKIQSSLKEVESLPWITESEDGAKAADIPSAFDEAED